MPPSRILAAGESALISGMEVSWTSIRTPAEDIPITGKGQQASYASTMRRTSTISTLHLATYMLERRSGQAMSAVLPKKMCVKFCNMFLDCYS